ncbi:MULTISPECIES: hypothetical protein [unclassified Clostridium]|uniref:hypothetical protein n=1 Tax=unclassified Clostridium TaxID=2614128 RepID=UPI0020799CAC|nr:MULTISPECIES: hypothetical protein [unclassified Clostridium]
MESRKMDCVTITTINGIVSPILYFIVLSRFNNLSVFILTMIIHNILLWSLFLYSEK